MTQILKAKYNGTLELAGHKISCAVIEQDEGPAIRVLVERSMAHALGKKGGGAYWKKKLAGEKSILPPEYVSLNKLRPFVSDELRRKFENPIVYKDASNRSREGIEATVLPDICDVWITARENGALTIKQEETAKKAYILMRGFAHVGIAALVDAATGYEKVRERDALEKILSKFLSDKLLEWAKTFPDEFYRQIFRLKNWQWKGMHVNRPQIVGHYTNDLVYERIHPNLLQKLKFLTPKDGKGGTPNKYFQWLSQDLGQPVLAQHLFAVITLMRVAPNWGVFYRTLQRAFPKAGETPPLFTDV
jgi:hypothetical protein